MKPVLIPVLLMSALGCGSALAQNSDLALMLGGFPSTDGITVGNARVYSSGNAGAEINYATQVHSFRAGGDLFVEVPLILTATFNSSIGPGITSADGAQIFFTPGIRWKFTHDRLSFYPAVGAGLASFGGSQTVIGHGSVIISNHRTTKAALSFAGAVELRISRLLGLRVEYRDLVTGKGLGGSATRNHSLISAGIVFHF